MEQMIPATVRCGHWDFQSAAWWHQLTAILNGGALKSFINHSHRVWRYVESLKGSVGWGWRGESSRIVCRVGSSGLWGLSGHYFGPYCIYFCFPLCPFFLFFSFPCFAHDLQVCLPKKADKKNSRDAWLYCPKDRKSWMELNFLTPNEKKTEITGWDCLCSWRPRHLRQLFRQKNKNQQEKLGVIFDSCFKFDQQITQVVKTCFFQSRLLWKVEAYFPLNDFERVIHLFISSGVDYCNSLYFGVDQSFTPKCGCMPFDQGRRRPLWLPVSSRIQFKCLLLKPCMGWNRNTCLSCCTYMPQSCPRMCQGAGREQEVTELLLQLPPIWGTV